MSLIPRWPLHPAPVEHDTFASYVRRLAAGYGVTYTNFCNQALAMSTSDRAALDLCNPSPAVLQRLSDGVGIPIEDLAQYRYDNLFKRASTLGDQLMKTPEGPALVVTMGRIGDQS